MKVDIGRGLTMNINVAELPQASLDHAIAIGLRNILMDSHAGAAKIAEVDKKPVGEVALAMAEKKLAALMSGDVRVKRIGGTRTSDPVAKHARAIAKVKLTAWEKTDKGKAARVKWAEAGFDEGKITEVMADLLKQLMARDDVQAEAKRRAEEEKAAADIDIDLDID